MAFPRLWQAVQLIVVVVAPLSIIHVKGPMIGGGGRPSVLNEWLEGDHPVQLAVEENPLVSRSLESVS